MRNGFAGKTLGFGIVGLVTLMLLASMWIFGWGFFQRATADFRGETAQIEKVHADPDYRIANYDWFFNQCAAVQNQEGLVDQLESEIDSGVSKGREAQIKATLTAVKSNRISLINDYNSRAQREDTSANFLASNLPHQLNPDEESTTCTTESEN